MSSNVFVPDFLSKDEWKNYLRFIKFISLNLVCNKTTAVLLDSVFSLNYGSYCF